MKPTWETDDGRVQLFLGDCQEVLPTLRAGSVEAVITDPPYGLNLGSNDKRQDATHLGKKAYEGYEDSYDNFVTLIIPRLNQSIDIALRAAVFSGPHMVEQRKPVAIGGVFVPCATGRTPWGSKQFLPLLLYGHPAELVGCHRPTVLTSTEAAPKNGHPCAKPLAWMTWVVELASISSEVVLDPFMGSGTTGVAALRRGRRFVGIEKEASYFSIAKRRIEEELARTPLFDACEKIEQPEALYA